MEENSIMEYIKIVGNKVAGHYCGKTPVGEEFQTVENFSGYVGIDLSWLDSSFNMKSEEMLLSDGLIKDCRGDYWDKETKSQHTIEEVGKEPQENWTDKPHSSMPYEHWVDSDWVEDQAEKEEYDKALAVNEASQYLDSTDYMVIKAMEQGLTLENLYPGETAKREAFRQTIRDYRE
jgi:hypothetical protein